MYVKDRMNKNTVSAAENISIAKALIIMKESRHKRLPVVDAENRPVGVIDQRSLEAVGSAKFLLAHTKISDIMEPNFFKIKEDTVIEECALLMKETKTGFVCVVNDEGVLTGVITSYDVLKGLMKLMDIRSEGCRAIIVGRDMKKVIETLSDNEITSIYTDGDNTIVKFNAKDAEEAKEKLSDSFEVLYFKKS